MFLSFGRLLTTKQLELSIEKSHQPSVGTRTGSAIGEPLSISAELRCFATAWRLANLDETTTRDIEMPRNSILKLSWPLVGLSNSSQFQILLVCIWPEVVQFAVYLDSSFVKGRAEDVHTTAAVPLERKMKLTLASKFQLIEGLSIPSPLRPSMKWNPHWKRLKTNLGLEFTSWSRSLSEFGKVFHLQN